MKQTRTRSLTAAMATSAVLAVLSTPAFAQDAAPSLSLPEVNLPGSTAASPVTSAPATASPVASAPATTAPAASAPKIVLPEPVVEDVAQPQAMTPDINEPAPTSSAQPEPTAATSAPARTAQVSPPRSTAAVPSEVSSSMTADSGMASADELTGPDPELVAPMAASPSVMDQNVPEQAIATDDDQPLGMPEEGLIALLALLGIGGAAGLLAMSRRRRQAGLTAERADVVPAREPVRPEPRPAAAAMAPIAATTQPAATPPVSEVPPRSEVPPMAATAPTAATMPRERAGQPAGKQHSPFKAARLAAMEQMADGPVPTGSERADLLRRMTAAAPDKYNPFTSPKARRRRARLILQTREQMWAERENQSFDWRSYKPSMKQAAPQPTMVTA